MDSLCVGLTGEGTWHVTTTSHPEETLEQVLLFAESWILDPPSRVEIIEV
ncbi:MAG: hypothetical protein IPM13_18520 [Phycisphaerales bacterium]|nr:hypothetical protein [Phycisphaerales bacterium]